MDDKFTSKIEVFGFCLVVGGFVFCSEIKISCKDYLPWLLSFIMATLSFTPLSGNFSGNPYRPHHTLGSAIVSAASARINLSHPSYSPAKLLSCIACILRRHVEALKEILL